ncbi:MAG: hypothetical protein EBT89_12470 [Opitutaceae bacterium]|nr:hypothetical protein [Opitutaceae bacterium]
MSGHPAPSREAGQGFTHPIAPSLTSSGRGVERGGDTRGQDPVIACDVAGTICKDSFSGGAGGRPEGAAAGHFQPVVMSTGQAGAEIGIGIGIGTTLNCNHEAPIVTHSLRGEGFDASEDGTGRGTPLVPVAFAHQAGGAQTTLGYDQERGTAPTLSKCQTPAVAWSIMPQNSGKDYKAREVDVLQPLMAAGQTHGNQGGDIIQTAMQVRRLTPRECERLQGFPDDYLNVLYRGKPAADGPKYKALGNSMAVPVMAWIGKRIQQVEEITCTTKQKYPSA